MSDTVEIPIPKFAAEGGVAKKPKRPAKVAERATKTTGPSATTLEGLSLNAALAEIETARIIKASTRKPLDKTKRPPPRYVRKRP